MSTEVCDENNSSSTMSSDVTCGVKRGSDELFSQTNSVSNGSAMSPQHNHSDSSDAKKAKLENNKPSRVVHIRNIPNDASERDIIHLGAPFGKVSNILVLKGKNQAFLEMADESAAVAMVSFFNNSGPPMIHGRTVYVQYSNHQELKTDSQSNAHSSSQIYQTDTQGGPNTVLRVIIDNQIYPVTLEVLYQIFSQVGKVLKIVTFTKNGTFQALIQYPDIITAQAAKLSLDGQNIYNGCCTLRIEYSKLNVLSVKYNNEKSRDFCNPTLPSGFGSTGSSGMGFPGNQYMNSVILVSNLNEDMVVPDSLFTLFGVYGDVKRVKILYNKKDNALIQMAEPQQAQLAITHLDKIKLYGKQIRVAPSKHKIVQMPKEGQSDNGLTKDYSFSPLHRFKKPGSKNHQNIYSPSSTLHLSNISSSVTEEEIKEAFSETGGEVVAFKFFPNDRKMALIQMGSVEESVTALIKMHNCKMSDSSHLRVSFSKSTI